MVLETKVNYIIGEDRDHQSITIFIFELMYISGFKDSDLTWRGGYSSIKRICNKVLYCCPVFD